MKRNLIAIAGVGVVAALAVAFLYLGLMSVLSSVIAGLSILAPGRDAPATSFAASPPNAPATVSPELSPSAGLAIAPTPGDLRPKTKDSIPPNQAGRARIGSTTTTSAEAESGKKQLLELLDAARADLANSGGAGFETQGANQDGEAADTASTVRRIDFQQFEAQMKATMEAIDANRPRIDQQAGAVAPEKRDGGTRHRRRH